MIGKEQIEWNKNGTNFISNCLRFLSIIYNIRTNKSLFHFLVS